MNTNIKNTLQQYFFNTLIVSLGPSIRKECKILLTVPPFSVLYLIPKSPLGPPGLWLAVRRMPPKEKVYKKLLISLIFTHFMWVPYKLSHLGNSLFILIKQFPLRSKLLICPSRKDRKIEPFTRKQQSWRDQYSGHECWSSTATPHLLCFNAFCLHSHFIHKFFNYL